VSGVDRRLIGDIARSIPSSAQHRIAATLRRRNGVDAKTGSGFPEESNTAGIASPLTEHDASTRDYWPERTIQSDYALFAVRLKPLKTVYMQDANGNDVVLQFDEPPV
jgi:hypothetical protein